MKRPCSNYQQRKKMLQINAKELQLEDLCTFAAHAAPSLQLNKRGIDAKTLTNVFTATSNLQSCNRTKVP